MKHSSVTNIPIDNAIYSRQCELIHLSEIQWDIEQLLKPWIDSDTHINFVTLAIIEALANIFEHNFNKNDINSESQEVIINVTRENNTSLVQLIDNGQPLPTNVCRKLINKNSSMPSVNSSELPESGWGLNLIQFAATSINYSRVNQKNYLELVFEDNPKSIL